MPETPEPLPPWHKLQAALEKLESRVELLEQGRLEQGSQPSGASQSGEAPPSKPAAPDFAVPKQPIISIPPPLAERAEPSNVPVVLTEVSDLSNEAEPASTAEQSPFQQKIDAVKSQWTMFGDKQPSVGSSAPYSTTSTTYKPSKFEIEVARIKQQVADGLGLSSAGVRESDANYWEKFIGGQGMTWLGVASLALAVAFFIPWAWIHFELPAWIRVLTFHLSGLAVLGAALFLRKRNLPLLARSVAGLGIFILYASAFAMEHHYKLWGDSSRLMTLLDCTLITAGAVAIAVRYNSLPVAVMGALGGYVIPLLQQKRLQSVEDFQLTFSYLFFLNLALLVVATIRPWRFLKPLALGATMLMFLLWSRTAQSAVWPFEQMVIVHAVLFLLATTLPALVWKHRSRGFELATLAANSLWFVGTTWLLFRQRPDQQMALVCWGMSALHFALFAVSYRRLTNSDRMPRVQLAMAAVFFTLAIPLQLENATNYLAYAWAAEGLVFTAIGLYFRDDQMKATGALVLGLAIFRVVMFDFNAPAEMLHGMNLDRRFLTGLVVALGTMAAGTCYWWVPKFSADRPNDADPDVVGGSLLGLTVGTETGGLLLAVGNILALLSMCCQWDGRTILILWTLDAALLWVAAYRTRINSVRHYALLVSLLMVGGYAIREGARLDQAAGSIANVRCVSLLLVAALYFGAGWVERKLRATDETAHGDIKQGFEMDSLLHILGHFTLLSLITFEVHRFWNPGSSFQLINFRSRTVEEHVAYSVAWAVYAAAVVAAGFVLRYRLARLVGLAGLLAVAAKVFLIDLSSLPLILRVLALGVLGGLLLVTSYWYQKFAARIDGGDT
ncbi:DUF2339 domain-containing protein [Adhaeretor mobilis]|uniref:DUF2339 domain-containing protein n=1 Tax=Adhaeretor mobilis TaxID=1930276 RepID=A0A517MPK7_9BACT|nr:DUF2339 domain-containing protein [Adhaeretor mobilis]QDS96802.1 hypothetical protein HG15A2_00600 [Adhaeretor mobilis]